MGVLASLCDPHGGQKNPLEKVTEDSESSRRKLKASEDSRDQSLLGKDELGGQLRTEHPHPSVCRQTSTPGWRSRSALIIPSVAPPDAEG